MAIEAAVPIEEAPPSEAVLVVDALVWLLLSADGTATDGCWALLRPSDAQVAATKALIGPPLPENIEWNGLFGSALMRATGDQEPGSGSVWTALRAAVVVVVAACPLVAAVWVVLVAAATVLDCPPARTE